MKKDAPREALEILLASLSQATRKQYNSSLEKWTDFCEKNKVDVFDPSEQHFLSFLAKEFGKGASYGTLNTHRNAVSLVSNNKIGEHPLIKRFLKGCFKLRPVNTKYSTTWDVNIVLDFLEGLGDNESISLQDLTYKTVMLLALSTAQRCQTLAKINIKNIFSDSLNLEIRITDIVKTSGPATKQLYQSLARDLGSVFIRA